MKKWITVLSVALILFSGLSVLHAQKAFVFNDFANAVVGHYELSVFATADKLWSGPNQGFVLAKSGVSLDIIRQGNNYSFTINQYGSISKGVLQLLHFDIPWSFDDKGNLTTAHFSRPYPLLHFNMGAQTGEVATAWFWNKDYDEKLNDTDWDLETNVQIIKNVKGLNYGDQTALIYLMWKKSGGLGDLWFFVKHR